MSLLDTVLDRLRALGPDEPPDPAEATREDVAEYCGIERPAVAPDYAVPFEDYQVQGEVYCERTGRQPDPPWVVVARYELPDGDREVLSHEAYAEVLPDAHDLADEEAEALALHRAGWLEADLVQEFSPLGHHAVEADDVLQRALEKAGE